MPPMMFVISLDELITVIIKALLHDADLGWGVIKAPLVNCSVSKLSDLAKVPLRLFESHLYRN